MKLNKKSLMFRIWNYLIVFSILILVFLWFFQVILIDQFYEWYKTKEVKSKATEIKTLYEKYKDDESAFYESLENISMKNGICIELYGNEIEMSYSSNMNRSCIFRNKELNTYKNEFINSNEDTIIYKLESPDKLEAIIFGVKIDDGVYAFLNTSIVPIDSTITILQKQLIIVTIIVILLSSIIAYFISNRLSNPISKLNKSASDMAKGDYSVIFPNSDISEINELSNTLNYAKEELKKTDDLRKDLIANVSHDLKTPLTMIKAYSEMVRDITYKDDVKREENLNVIIEEVDRLNLLISDILDLSKIQSNIEGLTIEEFDLISTINSIINRFDIFRQKEKYHFIFNHEKDEIIISADKKKIEQVIYNLIGNAINYAGQDKKIIVNVIEEKEFIRIEIQDHGKGIDPQDIDHIWDKYYKNEKNHKRNVVGTGLGLSIVKNILEQHSYKYGIKSKKDEGSTFYFEIKKD